MARLIAAKPVPTAPAAVGLVAALLQLNTGFDQWVDGAPADQRARAAFVYAAPWTDDIKRRSECERGSIARDGFVVAGIIPRRSPDGNGAPPQRNRPRR